jgi:hypothetical protein
VDTDEQSPSQSALPTVNVPASALKDPASTADAPVKASRPRRQHRLPARYRD